MKKAMILIAVLLKAIPLHAVEYQAGVHYIELDNPVVIDAADGQAGEVWAFFKYTCPACYQFHPSLENWQMNADPQVVIRKMPVFQPELYSRAFYAAQMLELEDAFHLEIYKRLHQDRKPLRSLEAFAELAAQYGADADEFVKMTKSFTVNTKVRQAVNRAGQAQVGGTPYLVVNGKYLLSGKMAGSNAGMLEVADYLLAKENPGLTE